MNKKSFKILLCVPPAYGTDYPPLGTPAVTAFLKSRGIDARQMDLNIKFFEYIRRNKLEFTLTKKYKEEKINSRVYYWRDLIYKNKGKLFYSFENVLGADFDFTEKMLSSRNLFRYINDEKENIFYKFFKDEVSPRLKKEKFDMVGFSIIAPSQAIASFTFGRIIKKEFPKAKVVIGGQWVSFFKEALIERNDFDAFYDYVICFEGETPLYLLIDSISRYNHPADVPNLIYKKGDKFTISKKIIYENVNELPCPDFDGLPLKKYSDFRAEKNLWVTFETSRGCYWNRCIFCIDLPIPKPKYRERNIRLLVDDIVTLKQKYKVENFMISNAVFSPHQMEDFSKDLIRRRVKIKWITMARFEKEFTKELLALTKKAGCILLNFGFESISQRVLDFCEKGISVEVIKRIIQDAESLRLEINLQTIIGLPSESEEEAWGTMLFLLNLLRKKNLKSNATYNIYYLIQKNRIFNNPNKYGIEFRKNPKLPFRFTHPFRYTLGNVDREKSKKLLHFYEGASYRAGEARHRTILKQLTESLTSRGAFKYVELVRSGDRCQSLRKCDKAIKEWEKALRIFPNSAILYPKLSRAYFNLNRYDEAIKAAKTALRLNCSPEDVAFVLGASYLEKHQYDRGIKFLKKAEMIDKKDANINLLLSHCYKNVGKKEQSKRELTKLLMKHKNGDTPYFDQTLSENLGE